MSNEINILATFVMISTSEILQKNEINSNSPIKHRV